jgi:hypothetical protein
MEILFTRHEDPEIQDVEHCVEAQIEFSREDLTLLQIMIPQSSHSTETRVEHFIEQALKQALESCG